jgi:alkanesulfonate monooxygenase SsuD/methylene tetrahydromethanopterin reductase-like flavin-dependent oxidoreductase (luciferase family)
MFSKIGKERGWPPQTRAQYNMGLQPQNALLVGDAETVAEKILYENRVLGGISRMTMMLSGGPIAHGRVMRSIELLGTRVAPIVRKELAPAVPSGDLEPAFSTPT